MTDENVGPGPLDRIERGVKDDESRIERTDEQLKQLFLMLKTDLIDEFLRPGGAKLKEQHIRILQEQVRHVVSVAKGIGYPELVSSFNEEERILSEISDLLESYPGSDVTTSPDLRASMQRLHDMLADQQRMIFEHEQILHEEKESLIDILKQVERLREDEQKEKELHLHPTRKPEFM